MSTSTDSRASRQEEEELAKALRASRVVELATTAAVGVAIWVFVDGGESTMPQEQILALQGGTMLLMLSVLGWALVLRFRLMDEPPSKERNRRIVRVQMVAGWMVFAGAGVTVITGSWAAFGTAALLIIACFLLLPVRPRGDGLARSRRVDRA